jgi:hypothetical protein
VKLLRIGAIALIALVLVVYTGAVGFMYFNQRALQYEATGEITALDDTLLPDATEISIPVDGAVINGWYQPPPPGKPLIVYYKGNSGSFTAEHIRFERFVSEGFGFLAFDYRGFPTSPGTISEAGILADAIAAYDWAAAKKFPHRHLGALARHRPRDLCRQRAGRQGAPPRNAVPVRRHRRRRTLSHSAGQLGHARPVPLQ